MRQKMIQTVQVVLVVVGFGFTVLATTPNDQLVKPPVQVSKDGGHPLPLCFPGDAGCPQSQAERPSATLLLDATGGSRPLPLCYPGDLGCPQNSNLPFSTKRSLIATDGGRPLPLCFPGDSGCPSSRENM